MTPRYIRLPHKNNHGHYYFGRPDNTQSPVIFLCQAPGPNEGRYFLCSPSREETQMGVLFEGRELVTFARPEEAMQRLNELIEEQEKGRGQGARSEEEGMSSGTSSYRQRKA